MCVRSSPSSRCASVAEVLARRLELELTLDSRLMELDFGDWEGQSWEALPRAALDRWAADPLSFNAPGGETGAQLIDRVAAFAHRLAAEAQPCIVVTHGGPLRLLPALLRHEAVDLMAPSPGLGSLSIVTAGAGRATV